MTGNLIPQQVSTWIGFPVKSTLFHRNTITFFNVCVLYTMKIPILHVASEHVTQVCDKQLDTISQQASTLIGFLVTSALIHRKTKTFKRLRCLCNENPHLARAWHQSKSRKYVTSNLIPCHASMHFDMCPGHIRIVTPFMLFIQ